MRKLDPDTGIWELVTLPMAEEEILRGLELLPPVETPVGGSKRGRPKGSRDKSPRKKKAKIMPEWGQE